MRSQKENMDPQEAVDEYIESRRHESAASTLQNYSYRLARFTEFCARAEIEELSELNGRVIEKYKQDRVERGGVNSVTLEQQLRTFRHFIKWCESNEFVEEGLAGKMMIPGTTPVERVRNDAIGGDRAREIVEHMRKFEYATRRHIVFELLWETGMRTGALRSLDVRDWRANEGYLELHHRPKTDTPLKLKERGERNITVSDDELIQAINDWIHQKRPDVKDSFGRKPLLPTREGRVSKNTVRHDVYTVVQPCRYRGKCPHDEEISECKFRKHAKRSKCPSSIYPHAIRSGAVSEHLNQDVPKEIVAERANMSQETLDRHYDERTREEKRKRREEYL